MTRPMIRIHDLETNEIIDREMTIAEFKKYETEQEIQKSIDAENLEKSKAKTLLLEKLGITEDEAKLLLS